MNTTLPLCSILVFVWFLYPTVSGSMHQQRYRDLTLCRINLDLVHTCTSNHSSVFLLDQKKNKEKGYSSNGQVSVISVVEKNRSANPPELIRPDLTLPRAQAAAAGKTHTRYSNTFSWQKASKQARQAGKQNSPAISGYRRESSWLTHHALPQPPVAQEASDLVREKRAQKQIQPLSLYDWLDLYRKLAKHMERKEGLWLLVTQKEKALLYWDSVVRKITVQNAI